MNLKLIKFINLFAILYSTWLEVEPCTKWGVGREWEDTKFKVLIVPLIRDNNPWHTWVCPSLITCLPLLKPMRPVSWWLF